MVNSALHWLEAGQYGKTGVSLTSRMALSDMETNRTRCPCSAKNTKLLWRFSIRHTVEEFPREEIILAAAPGAVAILSHCHRVYICTPTLSLIEYLEVGQNSLARFHPKEFPREEIILAAAPGAVAILSHCHRVYICTPTLSLIEYLEVGQNSLARFHPKEFPREAMILDAAPGRCHHIIALSSGFYIVSTRQGTSSISGLVPRNKRGVVAVGVIENLQQAKGSFLFLLSCLLLTPSLATGIPVSPPLWVGRDSKGKFRFPPPRGARVAARRVRAPGLGVRPRQSARRGSSQRFSGGLVPLTHRACARNMATAGGGSFDGQPVVVVGARGQLAGGTYVRVSPDVGSLPVFEESSPLQHTGGCDGPATVRRSGAYPSRDTTPTTQASLLMGVFQEAPGMHWERFELASRPLGRRIRVQEFMSQSGVWPETITGRISSSRVYDVTHNRLLNDVTRGQYTTCVEGCMSYGQGARGHVLYVVRHVACGCNAHVTIASKADITRYLLPYLVLVQASISPGVAPYALKLQCDWPGTIGGIEPATKNRTCPITKPGTKSARTRRGNAMTGATLARIPAATAVDLAQAFTEFGIQGYFPLIGVYGGRDTKSRARDRVGRPVPEPASASASACIASASCGRSLAVFELPAITPSLAERLLRDSQEHSRRSDPTPLPPDRVVAGRRDTPPPVVGVTLPRIRQPCPTDVRPAPDKRPDKPAALARSRERTAPTSCSDHRLKTSLAAHNQSPCPNIELLSCQHRRSARGEKRKRSYKSRRPTTRSGAIPTEVSIEHRRNEGAGETEDPRENRPSSGIVRHDSHLRNSGVNRLEIEPASPWWEASSVTAEPLWPPTSWKSHSAYRGHVLDWSSAPEAKHAVSEAEAIGTHATDGISVNAAQISRACLAEPGNSRWRWRVHPGGWGGVSDPTTRDATLGRGLSAPDPCSFVCSPPVRATTEKVTLRRWNVDIPLRTAYGPFTATSDFHEALLKVYFQDIPPSHADKARTGLNPRPGHTRIFACGNRAVRCRLSVGFLALSFRRCSILTSITLIGSQVLAVKRRPKLITHSLTNFACSTQPKMGPCPHSSGVGWPTCSRRVAGSRPDASDVADFQFPCLTGCLSANGSQVGRAGSYCVSGLTPYAYKGREIMQGEMHRGREELGSHGRAIGAMTTSLSVLTAKTTTKRRVRKTGVNGWDFYKAAGSAFLLGCSDENSTGKRRRRPHVRKADGRRRKKITGAANRKPGRKNQAGTRHFITDHVRVKTGILPESLSSDLAADSRSEDEGRKRSNSVFTSPPLPTRSPILFVIIQNGVWRLPVFAAGGWSEWNVTGRALVCQGGGKWKMLLPKISPLLPTTPDFEPMRVIEVNLERRRNEGAEETADPRENPLTNGIVRHDSH
ncbi:hypothetical protein PR048_010147 [Dryococelus australis]|uniref:Uncharacterized protein n=1 Tax=Dryococelus australis TaxID=614101 RepID=A0ABQ9I1X7_9NEOP|nr:hypothetical protein PR048_010147 [Dryococelus australis]